MAKDADKEWQDALTMVATAASATLGSSTLATQDVIDIRRARYVAVKVSGLTLGAGISLRVFFLIGDDASTPVYGYQHDIGGTEFYNSYGTVTNEWRFGGKSFVSRVASFSS